MPMIGTETQAPAGMPPEIRNLPPFPAIAGRLLRLLSLEDAPIQKVTELVRSEPAFAAEVLRTANSPLFGLASQVHTVLQACVVLGLERLRNVVLIVAMRAYAGVRRENRWFARLWRHSLATALLCEQKALSVGFAVENAHVAGLLHDIGRLGLLAAFPKVYGSLFERPFTSCDEVAPAEREALGTDHCAVGRWLLEQWKFPPEIARAAGGHHDPPGEEDFTLDSIVQFGCRMASALGFSTAAVCANRFEEVIGTLPESCRQDFPQDPEELRGRLQAVIDALA